MSERDLSVMPDIRESGDLWWKNAVIYEAYVDRFAGTFDGFSKRLDYIRNLGITCIHVLPHYPSPMVDDGYDVSDHMGIRDELGTLGDFSHFVDEAHKRGIRVLIDFVLNHTSTKHPWFVEASSSPDNPKRDYFLWSKTGSEFALSQNCFTDLKPSNWIFNPATEDYYFSTFYPQQADLNWKNEEVFSKMTGVIDFWTEMGVDGFRLDAASHLIKREGTSSVGLPETHGILKRIRAHLDTRHPGVILLAEVHEPIADMLKYFGNGDECHLVYHFPMVEQIFLSLVRASTAGMQIALRLSEDIPENCAWAIFLRNHDELSLATLGEEARRDILDYFDPQARFRFETGTSLRLATMFRADKEKILSSFEILMGLPGSPIIYYGDEIGMQNGALEPDEKDTRKSLREDFDWAEALITYRNPASLYGRLSRMIEERKEKQLEAGELQAHQENAERILTTPV